MSQPFGPYSPVREAGDFLFVSGQVGVDPATKAADADIAAQTRQALENMKTVLAEAGASLNDVVKTTIYLVGMAEFSRVNEVYEQFFDAPRPARSTIGVAELPRVAGDTKLRVEIEVIAFKGAA